MKVKLRVYANLADNTSMDVGNSSEFRIPDGSTANDLLKEAGIDPRGVRIVMINNQQADRASELKDGDEVAVFPSMGGF